MFEVMFESRLIHVFGIFGISCKLFFAYPKLYVIIHFVRKRNFLVMR